MKLEYREFPVEEMRFNDGTGETIKLSGHAAVFNKLSEVLWYYREKIAPGAFTKTIAKADVRLLVNHTGLPLARTRSKTLKLAEDEVGLHFDTDVDATDPDVQRVIPKLRRGDLSQMSFAFSVVEDSWEYPAKGSNDFAIRTLVEVDLFEISLVTFPAYPQTDVSVRSAKEVYDAYVTTLQAQEDVIKIEQQRALAAQRERQIKIWGYRT